MLPTVPVTSVDTRNLRNISFIKIDVQGYELAVCEGMKETLEKFPETCVCFEHSPDALVELGFEPGKVLDFFRSRGYRLHVLTREFPQVAQDDESIKRFLHDAGYVDLLCSERALAQKNRRHAHELEALSNAALEQKRAIDHLHLCPLQAGYLNHNAALDTCPALLD
ncbi:MAG TPA: FkbM family methyltransferase [Candidatus Polarisedimenticolia bacterium]|nr:FkbM family methyltransferase [Candidatus Polarisedimenticolia bacterium]